MTATWQSLNKRQQDYLKAVYEIDQAQESNIKAAAARGFWNKTPASVWRWMPYNAADSALLLRITGLGYRDHGTGSTFAALERRGLILCRYERDVLGLPILFVQITKAGRKLVRDALGIQVPKALPPGTLREWHWKAMVLAWKSRPAGVIKDVTYGHIGWNTWLRLRDYKAGGLVKEYETNCRSGSTGWHYSDWYIRLTEFGEQFYRENWQKYRDLYPDIEAPAPEDVQ